MINNIRKDMIEQLSYFIESNPKGYMLYDDVEELFNGVLDKYDGFNKVGYFDACKQLQAYKEKEDKLRELCESVRQHDWEAYDVSLEILDILNDKEKE